MKKSNDELILELEKKIATEYKGLKSSTRSKIADLTKDYEKLNQLYQKQVKDGKMSEKDYKKWKKKELTTTPWVKAMVVALAIDITATNVRSSKIIEKAMTQTYVLGHNLWAVAFNKSVPYAKLHILDVNAVSKIMQGEQLLPKPKINIPKDRLWNQRKMRSALMQSALTGEGVPELTKRLEGVTDMNRTSAIRNARTMMMHAHNRGKYDAGLEAIEQGIEMDKMWQAHIDSRTRMSHREINGEVVPFDEPFSNGLMFPQDFDGEPAEVYNCRCTLGYVIK